MEEQEAVPQVEWDVDPELVQVALRVLPHKYLVSVSVQLEHSRHSVKMVAGLLVAAKSILYTLKVTKAAVHLHSAVLLRATR